MIITIVLIGVIGSIAAFLCIRHIKEDQKIKDIKVKLATAFKRLLLHNSFTTERYEIIGGSVVAIDRRIRSWQLLI